MDGLHLRLPATSANLGPGFDALGLALGLWLDVRAEVGAEFSVEATGRNVAQVSDVRRNLMLETYRALAPAGPALKFLVHNEIPLGMGCGSSAAALLAGVMLANHFGALGLSAAEELNEACRREGHPDNVAACFYGGLTASSMRDGVVTAASVPGGWRLVLALPSGSLATEKARALLPESYSRADVVENIQAAALLMAAFTLGRPELLREGTRDRVHQPYRSGACPLLPLLLPMAGTDGVYSVTLSGAGPSVLLIVAEGVEVAGRIRELAGEPGLEVVETAVAGGAEKRVGGY